jgi:hypothetical protein
VVLPLPCLATVLEPGGVVVCVSTDVVYVVGAVGTGGCGSGGGVCLVSVGDGTVYAGGKVHLVDG